MTYRYDDFVWSKETINGNRRFVCRFPTEVGSGLFEAEINTILDNSNDNDLPYLTMANDAFIEAVLSLSPESKHSDHSTIEKVIFDLTESDADSEIRRLEFDIRINDSFDSSVENLKTMARQKAHVVIKGLQWYLENENPIEVEKTQSVGGIQSQASSHGQARAENTGNLGEGQPSGADRGNEGGDTGSEPAGTLGEFPAGFELAIRVKR